MIRVEKQKEPEFLQSEMIDLANEKMEQFYSSQNRTQKRYDFPFNKEIDKELKKLLHKEFYGKCGYCEIKIDNPDAGIADRYRPYNGVRDKKEYFQDLYWWLTYEWTNLIFCCKECSQYKANYFPVTGKRATSQSDDLSKERALILNPCIDFPDKHLLYSDRGAIHAETEKGAQTIELLRLDRTSLTEKRLAAQKEIYGIVEQLSKESVPLLRQHLIEIFDETNRSIELLSYKRWVLQNELDTQFFLANYLGVDHPKNFADSSKENKRYKLPRKQTHIVNDYFPIEYVSIKNFKGISDLTINFKEDGSDRKSWLFLLGENGVGKSSILQAIAIGIKANRNVIDDSLIPRLIENGKQKAVISIKERNNDNLITTTLIRKTKELTQDGNFSSFLMGYGSLRLSADEIESKTNEDIEKISYENLFKPVKPLNDITKWLKNTYKKNPVLFERIAFAIRQLLPHDFPDNVLTIEKGEIMFKNSEKLFSELSDGFKSTIILAVDLMMKLSSAQADIDKISGIALIDELGNQLHPRWQMRIVDQLRNVFPNVNFIVSTHHPLCLRGASKGEILLLKNVEGVVSALSDLPDPATMRVDQILASEFFGLSSMIDPILEGKFNRYYKLLSNENISDIEQSELNELKDFLREKKQMGSSIREELMYAVIDKVLAQKLVYNKSLDRENLKPEVIKRTKEIWKRFNIEVDDQD